MQSQRKIQEILEKKAQEIIEIEAKYYDMLKHEYLIRSIEIKKIPNFWYACLRNHHTLPSVITKNDWELMSFLEDLTVDEYTSRNHVKTYKISLEFKPNQYITNNLIWATVNTDDLQNYNSSGIDFKEGFSLEFFEDGEEKESFFRIFLDTQLKGLINNPGFVFDVINGIRIDLWEDPVKYYE